MSPIISDCAVTLLTILGLWDFRSYSFRHKVTLFPAKVHICFPSQLLLIVSKFCLCSPAYPHRTLEHFSLSLKQVPSISLNMQFLSTLSLLGGIASLFATFALAGPYALTATHPSNQSFGELPRPHTPCSPQNSTAEHSPEVNVTHKTALGVANTCGGDPVTNITTPSIGTKSTDRPHAGRIIFPREDGPADCVSTLLASGWSIQCLALWSGNNWYFVEEFEKAAHDIDDNRLYDDYEKIWCAEQQQICAFFKLIAGNPTDLYSGKHVKEQARKFLDACPESHCGRYPAVGETYDFGELKVDNVKERDGCIGLC